MQNQDKINIQQIKELLQKHLNRKLTLEEADQLFDQLKYINSAEEVDEIMRNRWGMNITMQDVSNLTWSQIVVEKNIRATKSQAQNSQSMVRQIWQWGIAASLTLMVTLALWWTWDSGPDYLTYTTGYGETRNIVLNDGSKVVLNANSSLTWNNDWKVDSVRFAELKGEAFFDVARIDQSALNIPLSQATGKRIPFQVKTSDLIIDVLGTMFNVSDRRGETQVYLEEGSIKLDLLDSGNIEPKGSDPGGKHKPDTVAGSKNYVLMLPGETVEYSAKSQILEKLNPEKSESLTEWKEGTLAYHDVDFTKMLEHLEDIYGKHFVVQDSTLFDTKVSIGLPYEDWKTVKSLMELFLQIELTTRENDQIFIDKR